MKNAAILAFLGLASTSHAIVTNSAWFRGGEADSNVVINGPIIPANGSSPGAMKDSSGNGLHLSPANNGANAGPYWVSTTVTGSSVAYGFDPGAGNFAAVTAPAQTNTTNWGIEAWFKTGTFGGQSALITVGTTLAGDGYGIYRFGSNIAGFVNGVLIGSFAIPSTSSWYYVGLVNNNGVGTLYFGDGVNPLQSLSGVMTTPNAPTGFTTLGKDTGSNIWSGNIDEARVFNFTTGQFSVSDLAYPAAIPEPSSAAALVGVAALGLCALRRRRRA